MVVMYANNGNFDGNPNVGNPLKIIDKFDVLKI